MVLLTTCLRPKATPARLLEEAYDRFALIAARSKDENVVAEAQRLSAEMIAGLARAAGTRGNALFEAGRG